ILGVFVRNSSIPGVYGKMLTIFQDMRDLAKVKPDESTYNIMMSMYLKRKDLKGINICFGDMQKQKIIPNTITYNIMIKAISKFSKSDTAMTLYREMIERKIKRNEKTFTMLFCACSIKRDVPLAHQFYKFMLNEGLQPDIYTYNAYINVIARNAKDLTDLQKATDVIKQMKEKGIKPTLVTYNILIKGLQTMGKRTEALHLFDQMELEGVKPNSSTLEGIGITGLQALLKLRNTYKVTPSHKDFNTCMDQALKESKYNDAMEILSHMQKSGFKPNVSTYSILMNAHIRQNDMFRAMELFTAMKNDNVEPDDYIYASLIDGFLAHNNVEQAFKLVDHMLESKVELNKMTVNRLIDTASKSKDPRLVQRVFERIERLTVPNKDACERVLWRIAQSYDVSAVEKYLKIMDKHNHMINRETFTAIITGASKGGNLPQARYWYNLMIKRGIAPDHMLISMIIRAHADAKEIDKTLSLWNDFHYFSIAPDDDDIMYVLKLCAETNHWKDEIRILGQLKELGYDADSYKEKISEKKQQSNDRIEPKTDPDEEYYEEYGEYLKARLANKSVIKAKERMQQWVWNVAKISSQRMDDNAKIRVEQWTPYRKND
ncbi:2563_t:CDS:1, partial [Cetraspora pellucida]